MKQGKPEFHEDYRSEKVSPLHITMVEFPYDEISRRLGEAPDPADLERQRMADAGAAFARILSFASDVQLGTPRTARRMGIRFAAAIWCISPAYFGGKSATELARLLGFKNPANFHKLTGAVARHLKITNRAQAHAWNNPVSRKESA